MELIPETLLTVHLHVLEPRQLVYWLRSTSSLVLQGPALPCWSRHILFDSSRSKLAEDRYHDK